MEIIANPIPIRVPITARFFVRWTKIVGGIETRWAGTICPPHRRAPHRQPVAERDIDAAYHARGEEMGRFAIGSSVILLFGPGALEWPDTLAAGRPLRLGAPIVRLGTGA